jgi:hypothetical protein
MIPFVVAHLGVVKLWGIVRFDMKMGVERSEYKRLDFDPTFDFFAWGKQVISLTGDYLAGFATFKFICYVIAWIVYKLHNRTRGECHNGFDFGRIRSVVFSIERVVKLLVDHSHTVGLDLFGLKIGICPWNIHAISASTFPLIPPPAAAIVFYVSMGTVADKPGFFHFCFNGYSKALIV